MWVTSDPCDFTQVFPVDNQGYYTYVDRFRPGSRTLISTDSAGRPLKAVLEVQFDVTSSEPGPIKSLGGSGSWYAIPHGWRLLEDRLGIEVTVENPEQWGTGNPKLGEGGDIRGITWQANPPSGKTFALRLTTVIDSDQRNDQLAMMRQASPTQFARERSVDAHEHFQYCWVAANSLYYSADGGDGTHNYVARDDTKAAMTHAQQIRTAHEMPPLAGSFTIPFLTDYYDLADRINIIQGRNANLQTNVAADQGEAPTYPWVVARSFVFEPRQETVLQVSDRRAEVRNAW